jgi:hypothetical protein
MSDYKRGKARVCAWANHWSDVADFAERNTTIEAKMMEYGVNLRKAFQTPSEPNVLMMSPWLKKTHMDIMELEVPQREVILVWHFGDEDERKYAFGSIGREPSKMKNIYKKIGRRV